jgi:hypothetical protein
LIYVKLANSFLHLVVGMKGSRRSVILNSTLHAGGLDCTADELAAPWRAPLVSVGVRAVIPRRAGLALPAVILVIIVSSLALTAGCDPGIDAETILPRSEGARFDADAPLMAIPTPTAQDARSLEGDKTVCEGDPWREIDRKCNVGKTHKHRSARAAKKNVIISGLPLGRSSSPPTASSVALPDPTGADPSTDTPTSAMPDPAGPRDPAPTKAHKSLRSRNIARDLSRDTSWNGDPWTAHASSGNHKPNSRSAWSWGWCAVPSGCFKSGPK